MIRSAVPLALFVAANAALVLTNESKVGHLKTKTLQVEEQRDRLAAEKRKLEDQLGHAKADLESIQIDLKLIDVRLDAALREFRWRRDRDLPYGFGGIPARAIDGRILAVSKEGEIYLDQGRISNVTEGMKFTIYREDRLVGIARVIATGLDWSALKSDNELCEPHAGDDASNHILMSTTRTPSK